MRTKNTETVIKGIVQGDLTGMETRLTIRTVELEMASFLFEF
jgi:hypothetical protein